MTGEFTPWLALGSVVISAASLLYTIFNGREKKMDARFTTQDTKIGVLVAENDLIKGRVAAVESELKHLPDKDQTHRLEIKMGEMSAELGRLAERMKPIGAMADRIQEALIDKVKF